MEDARKITQTDSKKRKIRVNCNALIEPSIISNCPEDKLDIIKDILSDFKAVDIYPQSIKSSVYLNTMPEKTSLTVPGKSMGVFNDGAIDIKLTPLITNIIAFMCGFIPVIGPFISASQSISGTIIKLDEDQNLMITMLRELKKSEGNPLDKDKIFKLLNKIESTNPDKYSENYLYSVLDFLAENGLILIKMTTININD